MFLAGKALGSMFHVDGEDDKQSLAQSRGGSDGK